jgi:hypothetical protein
MAILCLSLVVRAHLARVSHLANLAGQIEEHGVPRTWLASMRLLLDSLY